MNRLLSAIAFAILPGAATPAELVYQYDSETGEVVSGSFEALRAAVFYGREISIAYDRSDIFWLRRCDQLAHRDDQIVCFVNDVVDTQDQDGWMFFAEPFSLEYHIYTSDGGAAILKRNMVTGATSVIEQPWQSHTRKFLWFAN